MSAASEALRIGILPSAEEACRLLAREIAALVRAKPDATLGLPTGSTPVPLYRELVRLHREERLSFVRTRAFLLDEYLELPAEDPRSFRAWMHVRLFAQVDFAPQNVHIPHGGGNGDLAARSHAEALQRAGGIDLQVLGIGHNGHIGFNEPGSARESRTRVVALAPETRAAAAANFGGLANVPERAITLGVAEILEARAIRVLAFGKAKAEIVQRMLEGPIGPAVPGELPARASRPAPPAGRGGGELSAALA